MSTAVIAAEAESKEEDKRRTRSLQILWLWVLAVVLYFSWEAGSYRGLFAYLCEKQFAHLGQDLPTLTFACLAMAFAWPALLFARRGHAAPEPAAPEPAPDGMVSAEAARRAAVADLDHQARITLFWARDYMHFLFGFAAALELAALAALGWTLALPTGQGQRILFSVAAGQALPPDGPARLVGEATYGRIASFRRGILFIERGALYAPILPPAGGDGRIHLFVEFLPEERPLIRNGDGVKDRDGILLHGDLPGALVHLYRAIGYRPADHYQVLYASTRTMRYPYYILSAQFALGGLAFALFGLWQRRHIRKLPLAIAEERQRIERVRRRRRRKTTSPTH